MEERISLLFDFQDFDKDGELQAVIDAVHARYAGRQLSDDEAEFVAAAGRPEAAIKQKKPEELK